MKKPRLQVVERQRVEEEESESSLDDHDNELWQRASDPNIHLFLREPAITELARQRHPAVLDLCESLLSSDDIDDWHTAVNALAQMKTVASLDRLIAVYCESSPEERSFMVQKVAECLTSDHAASFDTMLKQLSTPCEIDISRWSSTAKAVLGAVCSRLGLTMTYVRTDIGKVHLVIH
jgi:hypothetical protein